MTDAYDVGISLAFDGGVSEGLAAIGYDLSAFTEMVEDSATGLNRLKRVTDQLGPRPGWMVSAPDHPRAPSEYTEHSTNYVSTVDLPVAPGASDTKPRSYGAFADGGRLASPFVPRSGHLQDGPEQPKLPSSALQPMPSRVPLTKSSPSALFERAATVGHYMVARATPLDRVQTLLSQPMTARPSAGPGPVPLMRLPLGPSPNPLVDSTRRPPLPRAAPSAVGFIPHSSLEPATSVGAVSYAPNAFEQEAGEAPDAPSNLDQRAASTPSWQSVVPPPLEQRGPALQGDVYLDGAQLGRWIMDQLARAAEGPRTGITGFDPRMTATWPGAPIGS